MDRMGCPIRRQTLFGDSDMDQIIDLDLVRLNTRKLDLSVHWYPAFELNPVGC